MYKRALDGYEKALGKKTTMKKEKEEEEEEKERDIGVTYEGKLAEAEKMYKRALDEYEKALRKKTTTMKEKERDISVTYEDLGLMMLYMDLTYQLSTDRQRCIHLVNPSFLYTQEKQHRSHPILIPHPLSYTSSPLFSFSIGVCLHRNTCTSIPFLLFLRSMMLPHIAKTIKN